MILVCFSKNRKEKGSHITADNEGAAGKIPWQVHALKQTFDIEGETSPTILTLEDYPAEDRPRNTAGDCH